MASYDYGNARIAALRSRLLDAAELRGLAEAGSAGGFLARLERADDWRPILRDTAPLVADPQGAAEASIERHRSARLGSLPGLYPMPARGLVEALVLPLDRERIVALVRRRAAGEAAEAIGSTIVGGALLDAAALGELARASTLAGLVRGLAARGLIRPTDTALVGAEPAGVDRRRLEGVLVTALERARLDRARGRGADAARVRALIAREAADRGTVARELAEAGPAAAALLERALTLARLDATAHEARRDPLGIGTVAGYVAAVEAQAIRLRACLARVVAGWGHDLVGSYLGSYPRPGS